MKCLICGQEGHTNSNCPDLAEPLKDGFYSGGGGGGGGHSHEEEDDRIMKNGFRLYTYTTKHLKHTSWITTPSHSRRTAGRTAVLPITPTSLAWGWKRRRALQRWASSWSVFWSSGCWRRRWRRCTATRSKTHRTIKTEKRQVFHCKSGACEIRYVRRWSRVFVRPPVFVRRHVTPRYVFVSHPLS